MSLDPRWRVSLCTVVLASWIATTVQAQTVQLFSDDFSRTTGLGSNWDTWYGTFTTDGAHAISGSPPINGNWASVVPNLGVSDYAISADVEIPPGSFDSGLVARSSDPFNFDDNLYAAQLSTDGNVHL
jgi:hypothetical protein